jgi:toxin ParE1/3/4
MRLIYHPEAEVELIEAARFYEQRVSTLGAQFLDAVDRAILIILDAPDRWRIVEADVRRYLMPRFPYAIYYRALPDHIRILAFKHHSRHPDYWRYRLSE